MIYVLQKVLQAACITRADIIDDAYDQILMNGLEEKDVNTFLDDLENDLYSGLAQVIGSEDDGREALYERLLTQDGCSALYQQKENFGAAGERLFEEFASDTEQSQRHLAPLIDLLKQCGVDCHTFGSDYEPADLAPQLVFIDLKLSSGAGLDTTPVIYALKKLEEKHSGTTPIVFLMSSLSEELLESHREEIRRASGIYASQFETLKKSSISNTRDLIRQIAEHAETHPLIMQVYKQRSYWMDALSKAQEELLKVLRDLDIPEYFVLEQTTTLHEGIGLGSYITDLLLEFLAHHVEGTEEIGNFAQELNEWGLQKLPRTRLSIDSAVERVYRANVLYHKTRLQNEEKCGFGVTNGFLRLGDIFLSTEEKEEDLPLRALAVITPECDLARPDEMRGQGLHILLCEGEVKRFDPHDIPSARDGGIAPVILDLPQKENRRDLQLLVVWKPKRPVTWTNEDVEKLGIQDKQQWHYAGRLRPLFALQLQHTMTADIGRIGVQKSPSMQRPHGVTLLVREGNIWKELDQNSKSDPTAGAVGVRPKKSDLFLIRDSILRDLLQKLEEWIQAQEIEQEPMKSLHSLLDEENFYSALKCADIRRSGKSAGQPLVNIQLSRVQASEVTKRILFVRPMQVDDHRKYQPGNSVTESETEKEQAYIVFCFFQIPFEGDLITNPNS